MNEIAVIVEGQTEQAFVRQLLQPHLAQWNMHIWATLPGRIFKRGGVRPWAAIQGDILRSLRERKDRICSTMFDFYAMPCDWPGRAEAARHPWPERGEIVECAMHGNIVKAIGSDFDPAASFPTSRFTNLRHFSLQISIFWRRPYAPTARLKLKRQRNSLKWF